MSKHLERLHDDRGMALLIAVVVLLMISAIGLTALQHAQDEASSSGRARKKDSTLYAADAGLSVVVNQLNDNSSGTSYLSGSALDDPNFIQDGYGNEIYVRTGTPGSALAEPIEPVGNHAKDGFQLNSGSNNTVDFSIYRTNVVATENNGGMVHLQAQFSVRVGGGGGAY